MEYSDLSKILNQWVSSTLPQNWKVVSINTSYWVSPSTVSVRTVMILFFIIFLIKKQGTLGKGTNN